MDREIGGYIEFEYNHGEMLHKEGIHLNCGRRAFSYLIKAKKIKKVWLPKFLCKSVMEPFLREKCDIDLYSVGHNFEPMLKKVPKDEWIVIINYYGQINNDKIRQIAITHPKLIVDNTQAYFQKPLYGIDTIYTCRKFFGVTDGAILYTDKYLLEEFQVDESFKRMNYLLGRFERNASEFYKQYSDNNSLFDREPIKIMSKITENILRGIDYDYVLQRRNENSFYLHNKLGMYNLLDIDVPEGAYMYPFFCEDGEAIRRILNSRKLYVPVLWPDTFDMCSKEDIEYKMANNILPLPVDQRYGIGEMDYIISEVLSCID